VLPVRWIEWQERNHVEHGFGLWVVESHDCAAAHGVDHLVALVRPDNAPSQRVARRLGMEVERPAHVHGADALVFGIRLARP
jgi:hypothetical protein